MFLIISYTKGYLSSILDYEFKDTNSFLQTEEIFKKVLTAMFITPGNYSFINSNNFLHTVYKNE